MSLHVSMPRKGLRSAWATSEGFWVMFQIKNSLLHNFSLIFYNLTK